MKKPVLLLLLITVAVQFTIPAMMIYQKEQVLKKGALHRFRTRPIDPVDPFQGRYVQLEFEQDHIDCPEAEASRLEWNDPLFVTLAANPDGFSEPTGWSRERPVSGEYIKTKYIMDWSERNPATKIRIHRGIYFEFPFNRFYMDEAKAPRAETAARDSTRTTNCWAEVRILNGKAVIEDVFAGGKSLRLIAAEAE